MSSEPQKVHMADIEDKEVSSDSAGSSFVPVSSNPQDAIQVVDENKRFNSKVLNYVKSASDYVSDSEGFHIISVFGSQSTGKSTLLNTLFNTNFDVMDESKRQQTTKGIWLASSPIVNSTLVTHSDADRSQVFVMDVEGTDGRERGEDQDFERKAALFALATSEILIVNIWESQIGLYQGANMGLLKTVFEVNLSLFGKTKIEKDDHKVLLLFVIRDHLSVTPLENLTNTLTQDLLNMWETLNKPAELEHLKFSDFFDVAFHPLAHKVLQEAKFLHDVKLLGDRFVDKKSDQFLFKPYYHHDIPIDGWTVYASNCWSQIDSNKDLDLPTQHILVARFRCDEIAKSCFEIYKVKFEEFLKEAKQNSDSSQALDYHHIGSTLSSVFYDCLKSFESSASKYNTSVYETKSNELKTKMVSELEAVVGIYAKILQERLSNDFSKDLTSRANAFDNFLSGIVGLKQKYIELFELSLDNFTFKEIDNAAYVDLFSSVLQDLVLRYQQTELKDIVSRSTRKIEKSLNKLIATQMETPSDKTWDNISLSFKGLIQDQVTPFTLPDGTYDFGLGTDDHQNKETMNELVFKYWYIFYYAIRKQLSPDSILRILKDRFEDKFRYDSNGLPKMFESAKDVEVSFGEAKSYALAALPVFCLAKLSDDSEVIPPVDIFDKNLRSKYALTRNSTKSNLSNFMDNEIDSDDETEACFAQVISEEDKSIILKKFKRETDARFVEAKRSVVQHVTQIPYYIYLIIMVLGWNEFMAIIRNPFFFSLILLVCGCTYILYHLNLLSPALALGKKVIQEAMDMVKEKLRDIILDDPELHAQKLSKISSKKDTVSIVDLSDDEQRANSISSEN